MIRVAIPRHSDRVDTSAGIQSAASTHKGDGRMSRRPSRLRRRRATRRRCADSARMRKHPSRQPQPRARRLPITWYARGSASHRRRPAPLLRADRPRATSDPMLSGSMASDVRRPRVLSFLTLLSGDPMPRPPPTVPDIDDEFAGDELRDVSVSRCLPHWTTPQRSTARPRFARPRLHVQIDENQPD